MSDLPEYAAITVKRKWAEKIGSGSKLYEVRRFRTAYRGPVVVTISGEKIAYCTVWLSNIYPAADVAYGASLSDEDLAFGPWAWLLLDARRCKPEMRGNVGKLGLWRWQGALPEPLTANTGILKQLSLGL